MTGVRGKKAKKPPKNTPPIPKNPKQLNPIHKTLTGAKNECERNTMTKKLIPKLN